MTQQDKSRAAFEDAVSKYWGSYTFPKDKDGQYENELTRDLLEIWKAAIEHERQSQGLPPRATSRAAQAPDKWNEAIKYLKRYQAWRTGEDDRTMDEAGITPSGITEALNVVLSYER